MGGLMVGVPWAALVCPVWGGGSVGGAIKLMKSAIRRVFLILR